MKQLLTVCIICMLIISCSIKDYKDVTNYEKFNKNTIIIIDNLNKNEMPNVLMMYYNKLTDKDFYKPKAIIINDRRFVKIKSKFAKNGYLYITKQYKKYILRDKNVLFVVNTDTINNTNIESLIGLKRKNIKNIDTIKSSIHYILNIKTK